MHALTVIFHQAMVNLEPDADALIHTLKDPLFKSVRQSERAPLLYNLAARLIMGGRLDEAQRIIPEIEDGSYTGGLMGWVRFFQGKNDEAITLFEADLKEARRRLGKRNMNFNGIGGLFYVLALLKAENEALLKRADQLVGWSLSSRNDADFKTSVYRSLGGIVQVQKLQVEAGKNVIANESKTGGTIPTLFNAMAAYWVNGNLSTEMISRIEPIFQAAMDVGMDYGERGASYSFRQGYPRAPWIPRCCHEAERHAAHCVIHPGRGAVGEGAARPHTDCERAR
jgi:hypothetical protein